MESLTLSSELCSRSTVDEERPILEDVLPMVVDGTEAVLVTDFSNCCVKSFYARNGEPGHSVYRTKGYPWGLAKLSERKVIVGVTNQLVILAVTPELVEDMVIPTVASYYTICSLSNGLLAAGGSFGVHLLRVGRNEVEIVKSLGDYFMFPSPYYLTVDPDDNVLVADWDKHRVTCQTQEGQLLWEYSHPPRKMFKPRGIAATETGEVMVVDDNSHKVIVLSKFGKLKTILTIPENCAPWGIHYDDKGYFYVAEYEGRILVCKFP